MVQTKIVIVLTSVRRDGSGDARMASVKEFQRQKDQTQVRTRQKKNDCEFPELGPGYRRMMEEHPSSANTWSLAQQALSIPLCRQRTIWVVQQPSCKSRASNR
uniref:Uncharacterized protein n=1 Tax=Peronospora matthiolae TaxID=2874970 RepID=A0AAV1V3N6_9STRA